jgi:amino-acid N-acetyltransferase
MTLEKETSNFIPANCLLRPARTEDMGAIRRLVLRAWLDPSQLRWQQFWVTEHGGRIIACGQLRDYPDAQELGSLVVAPAWRGQGLGRYLTQHLIQRASKPLYLECLGSKLAEFYTTLGFVPVSWQTLPTSLKRKFGFTKVVSTLLHLPLMIMQYQGAAKF